jgi:hypothetical protein
MMKSLGSHDHHCRIMFGRERGFRFFQAGVTVMRTARVIYVAFA